MKLRIGTVFFILACSLVGYAQDEKSKQKRDFTGTWLLDATKTNILRLVSRPDLPIKIVHQGPEFRVLLSLESNGQVEESEFIYFTDGRGENNPGISMLTGNPYAVRAENLAKPVLPSKTKWSGNKIVTQSGFPLRPDGRRIALQVVEWQLSADGKTLTQRTRVAVSDQTPTYTYSPVAVREFQLTYNLIPK